MNQTNQVQLSQILNHSSAEAVLAEVEKIFCYSYSKDAFLPVTKSFRLIEKLFRGDFPGYLACNTEYHNLGHTMDAFVATARLIDGRNIVTSPMHQEWAACLLVAALLHDTGYIQEQGDSGTGAKYTRSHVERSVAFIKKNAAAFDLPPDEIELIGLFISCTGLKVQCDSLCFESDEQVVCGAILGTADLLGQMADRTYLEKLLFLYYEFREAGMQGYDTEFDILKNTLNFYEGTKERLNHALMGVYDYAVEHFDVRYGVRSNLYIEAIERQMNYLRTIISDDSTNFRQKLKRIDLEKVISPAKAAV